ncbi:putative P450 monooxygenase [Whalleya microplaca]|nr:putative P450 monooxygenase [Whalleya microplaca]
MANHILLFFSIPCVLWTISTIIDIVYNTFFHPLRTFPGPLAAGATVWWKTYVELIQKKSTVHMLFELHEQHGSIVRIGPNELHFSKPSAYHDIYNASARWDKDPDFYHSFGENNTSCGFIAHTEAKERKDILQPLFSRRAIISMQGLIRYHVNQLVEALTKQNTEGKSSNLLRAFRSFTLDTISEYCFAKSINAISVPDFESSIVEAIDKGMPSFFTLRHFPIIRDIILALPHRLASKLLPNTRPIIEMQVSYAEQVRKVMADPKQLEEVSHQTIYHKLLDPVSYKGKTMPGFNDLCEEAQLLLNAGSSSVADTLITGFFNIMSQPKLYGRLQAELFKAWPDLENPPPFESYENLPFLTATIKESLRLSPGACWPFPGIIPPSGATILGKHIPAGAVVSMSIVHVHLSSEVFENPHSFDAGRWMGDSAKDLEQWLVPFGRGPRSCLGVNLAWCELYVAFATILRRLDMRLDGTTAEDMDAWKDGLSAFYYRRHLHAWCQPVHA